ncbi:phospholipid/cholesterol/gamma-HCH transport system substrate-binding protein [Sinomicrobium oceani]|uniref:Phospholipid/cholesterol/gamma-HCH transport system substrate-binding protein n=1 Tax=Sinomicrobium oceani TaxID=1150368 RepID=A0A1K1PQM8_9FLAO|nr:MlaD family protein [Sinomicrobium oceani]SFW49833.1 phospholipid/cholesterol/gamma-HCH transport system substrate-binding protein [Sinomicrobium oceani]
MKISRELKTAIIVLGGILLFILGFSFLKSNPIFKSYRTYYAVYDHVGGLATGTSVSINGFPVGKILDIRFVDERGKLLVTFSVENDFEFSKSSKAVLFDTGIIGGKGIQIVPVFDGSSNSVSGDTLPSFIKPGLTELVTQKLTPLQAQLGSMLEHADSVLSGVNKTLDEEMTGDLKSTVANIREITENFKQSSVTLNKILQDNKKKLDNSLDNIEGLSGNLKEVSGTLADADLGRTMEELQQTINGFHQVVARLENGEGSVGKLLKDEELYDNLTGASLQLEQLLQDMKLNPKRYVHFSLFGKRPKPYEVPDEDETETETGEQ